MIEFCETIGRLSKLLSLSRLLPFGDSGATYAERSVVNVLRQAAGGVQWQDKVVAHCTVHSAHTQNMFTSAQIRGPLSTLFPSCAPADVKAV